jgi:hypothetical protein
MNTITLHSLLKNKEFEFALSQHEKWHSILLD